MSNGDVTALLSAMDAAIANADWSEARRLLNERSRRLASAGLPESRELARLLEFDQRLLDATRAARTEVLEKLKALGRARDASRHYASVGAESST